MKKVLSRINGIKGRAAVTVGSLVVAGTASAQEAGGALPAEVSNAFSGIESNYNDLAALAWPVVGTIVGGFVLLKLFKKFANKAS
jgi:hypothetical protein